MLKMEKIMKRKNVLRNRLLVGLVMVASCLNILGMELPPDHPGNKNSNGQGLSIVQAAAIRYKHACLCEQGTKFLKNKEYQKSLECFKEVYENSLDKSLYYISTAKLGFLYRDIFVNHPIALKYYMEAYEAVKKMGDNYRCGEVACNIGVTYLKSCNRYSPEVRQYFNEAYTLSKTGSNASPNDLSTFVASHLGTMALYGDKNYKAAVKYLEEAYQSKDINIKMQSASNLGFMHLMGLGTKTRDFQQARQYFYEAYQKANPQTCAEISQSLTSMAMILLNDFDGMLEDIKAKYPLSTIKSALRYVKNAREILQEVEGIKFIASETIKSLIKEKHAALNSIEEQIKNQKKQGNPQQVLTKDEQAAKEQKYTDAIKAIQGSLNSNDLISAEKLLKDLKNALLIDASQQDTLKALNKQYGMQKRASLLNEFDILFKSCSKKTSVERMKKLEEILSEASILITDYSDIMEIKEKQRMLNDLWDLIKEEEVRASAKEKEISAPQEKYSILDPFDQIAQVPNNVIISINSHLEALSEDPLNKRDSEKLKGRDDTWRIRVGDYRILYTILPGRHAIGIVSIDNRKDVYENQESDAHREEWLRELNAATDDQIRLKIAEEKNSRKIEQLKKFLRD
jgi:mRNA interferase RelE/StbE